jgi:hypothetical protein
MHDSFCFDDSVQRKIHSQSMSARELRLKGNQLYLEAFGTDSKLPELVRLERGESAISIFGEAVNKASLQQDQEEWLSSMKNRGIACFNLATSEKYRQSRNQDLVLFQFRCAEDYLSQAYCHGLALKPDGWTAALVDKLAKTAEEAAFYIVLTSEHWPERCNLLEKVTPRVNKDGDKTAALVAAYMWSQIANEMMKTIVRSDENEDWREELRMIGEIERPLAICMEMLGKVKRHHTNQEFFRKIFDIKDSISDSRMKYLCRADSLRHRSIAEDMLHETVFEFQTWYLDCVHFVFFLFAASLGPTTQDSNQCCQESEAKTVCALGSLYLNVCKMPDKAHALFMNVIQICDSITHTDGSTFFHCSWYQAAKNAIEEYRRKREAYDQEVIKQKRAPVLEVLQPKLKAIDDAINKNSSLAFRTLNAFNFIYDNHPPKTGGTKPTGLDDSDLKGIKKALLKATTDYHPDKTCNKDQGMEWFVLSEEISKRFNGLYSEFKEKGI